MHQRLRRVGAELLDFTPARLHLSDTSEDALEVFDVLRGQHGIAELLRDRFAGGVQEFPVAVRTCVTKLCHGRDLRGRGVQHPEPSGGLLTVCGKKRGVLRATRLLEEAPTERPVRALEEAVIVERRDFQVRQDLLVNGALDPRVACARPFGDDRDSCRARPLQPVHRWLSRRDPQRRDTRRLRVRIELTPRLNGGVAHQGWLPRESGG